ncbi:DP-EP family protein [Duganella hordei]|jgi:hypothetical protein|uniref:DP-EP family protein n=1 Tax=Duganella hordei TaxID=2865934 RepID=UPI0030E77BA9
MTTLVPPATFINILVSVQPKADKPGHYEVSTEPPTVQVLNEDTVINYQIVDTDGYPIVFTGMTVHPKDNNQFSKETISIDGKLMAFIDANTEKMTLSIKLHFQDKDGIKFSHDPQIQNEPEG